MSSPCYSEDDLGERHCGRPISGAEGEREATRGAARGRPSGSRFLSGGSARPTVFAGAGGSVGYRQVTPGPVRAWR